MIYPDHDDDETGRVTIWDPVGRDRSIDIVPTEPVSNIASNELARLVTRGYRITDGGPGPVDQGYHQDIRVRVTETLGRELHRVEIDCGGEYHDLDQDQLRGAIVRFGLDFPEPESGSELRHQGPMIVGGITGNRMLVEGIDEQRLKTEIDEKLSEIAQTITRGLDGFDWQQVARQLRRFPAYDIKGVFGKFARACERSWRQHYANQLRNLRENPLQPFASTDDGRPYPDSPGGNGLILPRDRPRKIDLE